MGAVALNCDCVGNAVTVGIEDADDASGEANDGDADARADWRLSVDDELETDGARRGAAVLNCDCVGNAATVGVRDADGGEVSDGDIDARAEWRLSVGDNAAVVGVEHADVEHSDDSGADAWAELVLVVH
jgi:hypothetical protein